MTIIRAAVGAVVLAGAVAVTAQAAEPGNLRAGASRVDYTTLTPSPATPPSGKYEHEKLYVRAIGVGEDVRIAGGSIVGGGLLVDGTVVHLVAFPASAHPVSEG